MLWQANAAVGAPALDWHACQGTPFMSASNTGFIASFQRSCNCCKGGVTEALSDRTTPPGQAKVVHAW